MQFNSGRGLPLQVNGVHGFCSSLAARRGETRLEPATFGVTGWLFCSINNDRPYSTRPE
jgi:hypothetical protein